MSYTNVVPILCRPDPMLIGSVFLDLYIFFMGADDNISLYSNSPQIRAVIEKSKIRNDTWRYTFSYNFLGYVSDSLKPITNE